MNTINKIQVDGVIYNIKASLLTKVTYAELKEMRDKGSLAEGHLYRITDYEFTTVQANTKSADHVFDIIVLATTENQLSHIARAIAHEGDTYFDGNDLGAWELWYDLDNDTDKYEWADAENGKGVIYRMIDEKRNDCPYDFKNALFYNETLTTITTTDKYYYTFSYVVNRVLYDGTVEKQVNRCYGNSMGVYFKGNDKKSLNLNVFRNTSFAIGTSCNSNTFGNNCYSNTFGNNCNRNTFGNNCNRNTFVDYCSENTFRNYCQSNTFEYYCQSNTFWNDCKSNTFGESCVRNTFGNNCYTNTFGNNCGDNRFGESCSGNRFNNYCHFNTFENDCNANTFEDNCKYNKFENNVYRRTLNSENTSITLNDEYYDDASGQLVPIKHPDLSTQPSILPYKFMGQYVYEQLVVANINKNSGSSTIYIDWPYSLDKDKIYLDVKAILAYNNGLSIAIPIMGYRDNAIQIDGISIYNIDINQPIYLHVIYTSRPEEGDYYGYNNY